MKIFGRITELWHKIIDDNYMTRYLLGSLLTTNNSGGLVDVCHLVTSCKKTKTGVLSFVWTSIEKNIF